MDIILDKAIKHIMSTELRTVSPNAIGSEIADIFENNNFHHLPVVDADKVPVGIISASDYHQLQHHFTRLKLARSNKENEKIFRSILAKEIMSKDPVCIDEDDTIASALDIFIKNEIRALLVTRSNKLVGIITPIDILKSVVGPALIDK
jgi:CBS domain-containing protein